MIYTDRTYRFSSTEIGLTIDITGTFHVIRKSSFSTTPKIRQMIEIFSDDIRIFLESLHPDVSARMINDFLTQNKDQFVFESEVRAMKTFEKHSRKLKYKKTPNIQIL